MNANCRVSLQKGTLMSLKRTAALVCATVIILSGCTQKSSSTKRLAFITNNAADFWTIARKGTEKADAELQDVVVEFRLGDGTAAAQKRRSALSTICWRKASTGSRSAPSIRQIRPPC